VRYTELEVFSDHEAGICAFIGRVGLPLGALEKAAGAIRVRLSNRAIAARILWEL
jgi:hypothetical protein